MYCNKCHTLIPNNELKCPKCGYINEENTLEETKEIDIKEISSKQKIYNKKLLHYLGIIILIIIFIIIIIYIFHDSNNLTNNTKTYQTSEKLELNDTFTFNNIELKYNHSEYGTSKNTIFNKKDNSYNIELKIIKQDQYEKYINEYNPSDIILGTIPAKSFVLDASTAYIFISQEDYYLLTINANNLSSTLEHLKRLNDLSEISNSLTEIDKES